MKFLYIIFSFVLYKKYYGSLFKLDQQDRDSIRFQDYLTKNPFPKIQLINMKDVYEKKLSKLDERFLLQNSEDNKQIPPNKIKPEKANSTEDFEQKENKQKKDQEDVQKTPQQLKNEEKLYREERKRQYQKIDNIDVNQKMQYFTIEKTAHCDPYLRKHFINEEFEVYAGFQAQDTIPQQIQEKCYTLKKNCCSLQEMNYLDVRAYELIQDLKNQQKNLKRILIKMRELSYEQLSEEFKNKQTEFKKCMKGDIYQFDLSLKDLFNYLFQYEDQFEEYIDFLTHRIYDYSCSFCNAEDTDYFLYSHKRNMYINTAKVPEAIKGFYTMYNKVQQFYKIYAFANFMYCFRRNQQSSNYDRRHLDYQDQQDIEKLQNVDKNQLLQEEQLMNYFQQNYFPGILYIPNFEDILKVIKIALNDEYISANDEDKAQSFSEHQITTYDFLITEYVLKNQQKLQDDFNFNPKTQIILLDVHDGYYDRKMKYDPRKIPLIQDKSKIVASCLILFLISFV